MYEHLPAGELLDTGLRDLKAGVKSVEALLVLVGAPRLARNGIQVPAGFALTQLPEHELYDLPVVQHGAEAYRHYRSLIRRLVSLENALDNLKDAKRV